MNDLTMIKLLKEQDPQGMVLFLKRYTPLIRYIISPILSNPHDQEECISEISIRVWEKIVLYDVQKGNFTSWLTVLARNTALNRIRQTKTPTEELSEAIPSDALTPEEIVLKKEEQLLLRHAINRLSPNDQQLFYRKYYYLQSISQIACELGMTERSVEGRLYRIKKQLRKLLGGE